MARLKPYVRYDGNWKVIPGSLVLRTTKPKDGRWGDLVLVTTSTTSTTSSTTSTTSTSSSTTTTTTTTL